MEIKQRDALIKKIIEVTEKVTPPKKRADKISEKGRMALAVIEKNDFGCYSQGVRELASVLLGEELPNTKKAEPWAFEKFQAVMTIGNPNSHNYYDGKAAIVYSDGVRSAIRSDGTLGNNLPDTKENLRPASVEEISELTNAQLEAFAKKANITFL